MADHKPKLGPKPRVEALESREVPAVIGGVVYHDANGSGLLDGSESGLGGVNVRLEDSTGTTVATTVSNDAGRYEFTINDTISTAPRQAEHTATFAPANTDFDRTATVSRFDPRLGTLTRVDIVAEGSITSQASIENMSLNGSTVETELNGTMGFQVQGVSAQFQTTLADMEHGAVGGFDGTADLSGSSAATMAMQATGSFQAVSLSSASELAAFIGTDQLQISQQAAANACACSSGNLMAMIQTLAQGSVRVLYTYTPSNEIAPGTYRVVEGQPGGFADGRETPDNVTSIPGSESTDHINVTVVTFDDQTTTNHFGEVRPASLAGYVYFDADRSTDYASGDTLLPSVTVTLTGTDVFGTAVSLTTTTDGTGAFAFTNLRPGTYTLTETQPDAYLQGTNRAGTHGGSVSGDTITGITLASGDNATNYSFGEVNKASLAGFVYYDVDRSTDYGGSDQLLSGVTVTLTGTDDLGNAVTRTTTTDGSGAYLFTELRGGSYTVTETQPDAYLQGTNRAGTHGGSVSGDVIGGITLVGGDAATGYSFGEVNKASLAGFVYYDADRSTDYGGSDQLLSGVTVTLTGTDDLGSAVSLTTTTDSSGAYSFTELRGGSYTVTETQPTEYLQGTNRPGTHGGAVSGDAIGGITLVGGDAATGYSFGELRRATLAGYVYYDVNRSGGFGGTDRLLAGVTVTLTGTDSLGAAVSLTTTTDDEGAYLFTGLAAGTYTVTETQPADYRQGTNRAGTNGGTVTGDTITDIALAAGDDATDYSFGEVRPGNNPPPDTTPPPPAPPRRFNKLRFVGGVRAR